MAATSTPAPAVSTPLFDRHHLSGWGRYPVEACNVFEPRQTGELAAILKSGGQQSYIPRGLGRSYGDAALNREHGVIAQREMRRILGFDAASGVLECEAGASLAEVIAFALPRGYFLPVTPGTKFVTLGGAIAADVHGKNHHRDGSLGGFLKSFDLMTGAAEVLHCSPSRNPDAFWATVGGMGLTGIILRARLQLRRVESAWMRVDCRKARCLDEALDLMREGDEACQYSVAWIDCLARGRSLGRCVLMLGNHAEAGDAGDRNRFELPRAPRFKARFDLPAFALNSLSIRAFNAIYYHRRREARRRLVHLDNFFYPLDGVENWNRLYGRRGFIQYQFALPLDTGREALRLVLERLASSRRGSFLAVLKRFGRGGDGLLSFPMEGYTLSLDLPCGRGLSQFLRELDRTIAKSGGRFYLAKDAVQAPEIFAAGYPRLRQFLQVRRDLDPDGLFSSSLARRLGI